jgi:threonine dehydrogenase-like Zn-dependent dehydrogenase
MHGWCVPFDIAGPKGDEVLVRTIVSAVSTGTEVAVFSSKPNTGATFPSYPGYSGVGEIVRVGRRVRGRDVGQVVAGQAGHASLAVLRAQETFPVPPGMPNEAAAMAHIGVIAQHGVRRAQLRPGERTAVFGRGVIGQLACQLARAAGAAEVISIARTPTHVTPSLCRHVDRVIATAGGLQGGVDDLGVDVTFEVTGDPAALHAAVRATRDGGRVILLGSSRGITSSFDLGSLADRSISLVGANIRTLTGAGAATYRRAGEAFLRLVADGQVDLSGLIDVEVNPWEAGWFYRQLANGCLSCVAPILRWDWLDASCRLQRVRYWSPPDVEAIRGRTMLPPAIGWNGWP